MAGRLSVSLGQHSSAGRKEANDDFHGALVPEGASLGLKGIAVALADGIGSSRMGGVASGAAVRSFLADYYCTSESWSVKTSAHRVIAALNSWLYAETRRSRHAHDPDRGHACTFSVAVLKSRAAHIFHIGDSRVCRLAGRTLEQLTEDHRVLAAGQSYLGRALGVAPHVEIDYRVVPLAVGDVLVLTTDGVHDHLGPEAIAAEIAASPADLDAAARRIVERAFAAGSPDNLTAQLVRIEALPPGGPGDLLGEADELPPAPLPEEGAEIDGYRILRRLHGSSRSHVFLAADTGRGGAPVALKLPSLDLRDDPAYRRRFLLEEWVARRLNSPHVLRMRPPSRRRSQLYLVMEHLEGGTLAQWMLDHPAPPLEAVRGLVEQIARGLDAFHRKEMVHQDLRPANVMVDAAGTARIIDFGSTRVAGVAELEPDGGAAEPPLGTAQYTAPECLLGEPATPRADIFSLGVIAYQMLTGGRLPYGADAARLRGRAQQRRLRYRPARDLRAGIPAWMDGALRRAVHPLPERRYGDALEFAHDLRTPNPEFAGTGRVPLAERDPLLFWKVVSFVLALLVLVLLAERAAPAAWPPDRDRPGQLHSAAEGL